MDLENEAKLVRELPITESVKIILRALYEAAKEVGLAHSFSDLRITKVLPEGPALVIYVRRRDLVGNDEIAKRAAKRVKKRMELRADESIRDDPADAMEKILAIIPEEAGVTKDDIIFDETRAMVQILAENPRIVIGTGGERRKEIIRQTGWIPKVIKKPDLSAKSMWLIYRMSAISSPSVRESLISIGFRIHRPRIYRERDLRITFLGAAREVGRSGMLIQTPNSNIIVDFGLGMSHGGMYPRLDIPNISLDEIDAVILTHAHMDHSGLIPRLYKFGYKGPVYMTTPTRDLVTLLWLDYLSIVRRVGAIPPFSEADINTALQHTITIDYNMRREEMRSDVTDVAPDVRLTFYNAGHILGSAIVHLHIGDGLHNIVIAQDFRYSNSKLLDAAAYKFPRVETLIIESTYGDKNDSPNRKEDEARLIAEIKDAIAEGGRVLIPVLSVGRAQEVLLHIYYAMKSRIIPEVPVYIDGMVADATAIHTAHTEFLSKSLKRILRRENPFTYENFIYIPLHTADRRNSLRSEALNGEGPAIILASNGMLNGGPSLEYFKVLAPNKKNKIIFVSYQAPGTLGEKVINLVGKQERKIQLSEDVTVHVNAKIAGPIRGLTSHSTYPELLRYIKDVKNNNRGLKTVLFIHGEYKKCLHMAYITSKKFGLSTHAPSIGETVKLL